MWVFGGYGSSPDNYLNNHGDFRLIYGENGENNQLFSYDPSKNMWTNAECFGTIPSPHSFASIAKIQDNVWLYGGTTNHNHISNEDMYELNMLSFVWTKIETTIPRPNGSCRASLTPISGRQLAFYGGLQQNTDNQNLPMPWIFDVKSHAWSQPPAAKSHHRCNHTGITGLSNTYYPWWEHYT